jgi:hypothetical protein
MVLKISGLAQTLLPGLPHFACFSPICPKGHMTPLLFVHWQMDYIQVRILVGF